MALAGLKVIEFAGLAPGPFVGLVLADHGASVIRVDRPSGASTDVLCRGKRSIAVNSKVASGRELLKSLIATADVVIDPFRPGVMERLGLGPEVFLGNGTKPGLNEKLIYARIVGFPREGPYKDMAGHDINYAALSGVLAMLPGTSKPMFPLNILSDFAGGGAMCAMGILVALVQRSTSGKGQVLDADMVTGTRYISSFPLIHAVLPPSAIAGGPRGTNALDGGAPFYNVYTCKDGGWMSVGCLEPEFFKAFLDRFNDSLPKDFSLNGWKPTTASQRNREEWPKFFEYLEKGFLTKSRDEWAQIFMNTEACTVAILSPKEAGKQAQSVVPEVHPKVQSFNAPASHQIPAALGILEPGQHTDEILKELNVSNDQMERLVKEGAIDKNLGKPRHKL